MTRLRRPHVLSDRIAPPSGELALTRGERVLLMIGLYIACAAIAVVELLSPVRRGRAAQSPAWDRA